jgi:hemerythrin-like domain-containing protein
MLTATYTLVALSVEQASVRVSLQSFQKYLQANFAYQSALTPVQVEFAWKALQRLYDTCHWRKIETFLIPAIRKALPSSTQLFQELESLNGACADLLGVVDQCRTVRQVDSEAKVVQFCQAIDSFCSTMLRRLELEEKQLFPLARSVISGEAWFSIANRMLASDAHKQEAKACKPPGSPAAVAAAAQPDLFPASVA